MTHPHMDYSDARANAIKLADARRRALKELEDQVVAAADAEAHYRQAKAKAIIAAEGRTAAEREAVADAATAKARRDRDIARGFVDVCKERLRGIEGERAILNRLCEWSLRLEGLPQPQWTATPG